MKKFTLLILVMLLGITGVNAKTRTTKILWEGTYSNHIEISKDKLAEGTLTIYMSWTGSEGTQVRAYYKKNDSNWTESKFSENSGTIKDYEWQNNGTASYEISIAASDMTILNDNTADTGSRGILYIGSADASKMKITMITFTTTTSESETSTTSVWSGTHDLANYSGLDLTGETYKNILKNAKIGDVLRATYTSGEAGNINFCNGNGWAPLIGGSFSVAATTDAATVEYEIFSATVLEAIQQNGIAVNGNKAILSAVELLTYDSSYDAVPLTIGSDGIATFGSSKNLDFSGISEVTPYYVSEVNTGSVTLTSVEKTRAWAGYIVQGTPGTYSVPVNATGPDWIDAFNNLIYTGDYDGNWVYRSVYSDYSGGGDRETKIKTYYRYIFAKNSSDEIGFYKLAEDFTEGGKPYHVMSAHKAYLETTEDITPSLARAISLVFDGGNITDINTITEKKVVTKNDGITYNLNGQVVTNPSKGIYIKNGKKFVIE